MLAGCGPAFSHDLEHSAHEVTQRHGSSEYVVDALARQGESLSETRDRFAEMVEAEDGHVTFDERRVVELRRRPTIRRPQLPECTAQQAATASRACALMSGAGTVAAIDSDNGSPCARGASTLRRAECG